MGDIRGKRCDRDGCDIVVEGATTTPKGWIQVRPIVGDNVRDDNGMLEYCSNFCFALVAVERYEDIEGKRFNRGSGKGLKRVNPNAVEQGKHAAHVRLHSNKSVDKEGCKWCDEAAG